MIVVLLVKRYIHIRMYYSQQSYQEERVDNYAVFLPNNYVDIPGEQGEITKVITFNKNLTVLCTEGVFVMPKNTKRE